LSGNRRGRSTDEYPLAGTLPVTTLSPSPSPASGGGEQKPVLIECSDRLSPLARVRGEGAALDALPLPELAADMVARLGFTDTLRIIERLGGLTVRIAVRDTPAHQPPREPLARLLGQDLECALHRHYASEILYIPRCAQLLAQQRNCAIHGEAEALLRQGKGMRGIVATLARQFGLSDRRIWDILKLPLSGETNAAQPSLF